MARPTPSPTPAPTATQPVTLSTEDSIAPVTCNGSARPDASRPFLTPPYHGWTSIVSYFDHDSPNFLRDGQIVIATGASARVDMSHRASDFPAYWSKAFRQYLYYDGHNGYDYDLSYQRVFAAAPGRVLFAAFEYPTMPNSGYGKMIMIAHRGGYVTLYGHFSRLLVRRGERVKRGALLGISGNTGHSSGPHLHFTVFHNCTPTDPYGWIGGGPDPLLSYKGESSEYLWIRPPLVTNTAPNWPGASSIPSAVVDRYLVLSLPSATGGTTRFTHALRSELSAARAFLRRRGISSRPEPLLGALWITGKAGPGDLYAAPHAASLASSDVIGDMRADVIAAIARAGLTDRHIRAHIGPERVWTGYLFQWQGRTFLVGRGRRGASVAVRFGRGGGREETRTVRTDVGTGAYAVDLGRLTPPELRALRVELARPRQNRHSVVGPLPKSQRRVSTSAGRDSRDAPAAVLAPLGLLLLVAAALAFRPIRSRLVRRRE